MSEEELDQYLRLLTLNLLALTALLLKHMEEEELRYSWFKLKESRKKITRKKVEEVESEKAGKRRGKPPVKR